MGIISFNEASTANSRIESFIENPDSTSGIVTVPKVIASGETITIPAGRVAVLPNVQVDGVLNIEGEVFVPSGSTYGDLDAQIALKADTSYVNSKYSGFKNYIINGKKVVNQRALTSTDNSYNQDRWYKVGNNWFQGIEGDNNLISGKNYTLSWAGSATASYYVGDATSSTINAQSFTNISNGGNFTLTISAGQNLWIKFASDATGSTFNFVQLEEGTIATPFEQRPIGLELSLCQRYYEKLGVTSFHGYGLGGNGFWNQHEMRVTKRVSPTIGTGAITAQTNCGIGTFSASIDIVAMLIVVTSTGAFVADVSNVTASAEL